MLLRLARRSGSPWLRAHARVVLYAFPILSLRVLLFYWSGAIDAWVAADYVLAFYQALDFVAAAGVFALLVLLGRMYETLRTAAVSADAARS